jgi:hypothetical protein
MEELYGDREELDANSYSIQYDNKDGNEIVDGFTVKLPS